MISSSFNKIIRVTRIRDGKLMGEMRHTDILWSIVATPDNKHVVLAFYYSIRVMRLIDCNCIREIDLTNRLLMARVFDKHIVWKTLDNTIRITRIKDGKLVHKIPISNRLDCYESICLSLDGKYIVVGSSPNGEVCILLNPVFVQTVQICRQWARILLWKRNTRTTTPTWRQLLAYFQMYPGLVQYVGTKLMLCVFNV